MLILFSVAVAVLLKFYFLDEDTHKAQSSKTRHNSHTNLWEPAGTGSRLFGSQNIPLKQQEAKNKTSTPPKKV